MLLHLLLTDDIKETMPDTVKVKNDFGPLWVVFEKGRKHGQHCIVEDTTENMIKWLSPFDGFVKGNGVPMMESFSIAHIKPEL